MTSETPENLLLEYMRRFDKRMDGFSDDLKDMKARLSGMEEHLANMRGEMAAIHKDISVQNRRLDRLDGRMETFERIINISDPKRT